MMILIVRDISCRPTPVWYQKNILKSKVEWLPSFPHYLFQKACVAPAFAKYWENYAGLEAPYFYINPHLQVGTHSVIAASTSKTSKDTTVLPKTAQLGVVFHGTASKNIDIILKEGLDPARRNGQAYGPGEYFGKTPRVSIGYCHGGLEMLVFVVVLPSEAAAKYAKDTRLRGLFRMPPPDFCVVNNNLHQLPIETLRFKSVQHHTLDWSFQQKQLLAKLNQELKDKTAALEETTTKAKIIQHLISERIQEASEAYSKDRKKLLKTSKREIAWYVHQKLEADVIPA